MSHCRAKAMKAGTVKAQDTRVKTQGSRHKAQDTRVKVVREVSAQPPNWRMTPRGHSPLSTVISWLVCPETLEGCALRYSKAAP